MEVYEWEGGAYLANRVDELGDLCERIGTKGGGLRDLEACRTEMDNKLILKVEVVRLKRTPASNKYLYYNNLISLLHCHPLLLSSKGSGSLAPGNAVLGEPKDTKIFIINTILYCVPGVFLWNQDQGLGI